MGTVPGADMVSGVLETEQPGVLVFCFLKFAADLKGYDVLRDTVVLSLPRLSLLVRCSRAPHVVPLGDWTSTGGAPADRVYLYAGVR